MARLREVFGLSEFERDVILLLAPARRSTGAFARPLRPAAGSQPPTFGLALAVLENPHWSAVSRVQPLRYWRLIEIGPGTLLEAPLMIDERILQFLLGVPAVDERLESVMHILAGLERERRMGCRRLTRPRRRRSALAHDRAGRGPY